MELIHEKLDFIFKDVIDVTDPSCMEKVLMLLEQARIESEEYMELLVNKLQGEEVTWEQPAYQQTYWLTRKPPDCDQYASGHFTKAEGEMVQKNWDNFISEYEVPDTPIYLARWKNRAKKFATHGSPQEHVRNFVSAYLARGLRRNLYQVNRYFITQYAYPVKLQRYTAIEEKIMEICFIHQPKDACIILSEVLGREPRGLYKRYSQYTKGKPERKPKLKWELDLVAKFIRHLVEYSQCSCKALKNKQIDKRVWLQLEQEIGPLYLYLREFWISKVHVQLFAKCNIKLKSLRKIICKKLAKTSYEIFSDIRWQDVAKEFPDGITGMFLYKVAKSMWSRYADYLTCPLPELLARAARDARTKWRNKRLKSLRYKHGELTYITHDIALKQMMKQVKTNEI